MDEPESIAWLARRVGWGLAREERAEWQDYGVDEVIDRLVEPDTYGVPVRPDPFGDIERRREDQAKTVLAGISSWIEHGLTTPRPLETFMEFFWSDYFAINIRSLQPRFLMFDHMSLLARHALGNFGDLLRDVTVDAAMLRFLDGGTSTAENPNENFGRELLELYSVGVGNFDEDDVAAAAAALTGWVVPRVDFVPRFRDRRHDDSPQTLLGVEGVHDVETTIDAVLAHPATAARVAARLADAILGPDNDADLDSAIDRFRTDWELKPLVRELLTLGAAGEATPAVVAPVPWLIAAMRLTGARPSPVQIRRYLSASGQVPLAPPNVGGFPGAEAYLSTSATIARFNFASHIALRAPRENPLAEASGELNRFADMLGLPRGFSPSTKSALEQLDAPVDRIAAALASPDLMVV